MKEHKGGGVEAQLGVSFFTTFSNALFDPEAAFFYSWNKITCIYKGISLLATSSTCHICPKNGHFLPTPLFGSWSKLQTIFHLWIT
jgi:hypothetical protein